MKRILLVEDEQALARHLTRLLQAEGFTVVHAATQRAAVACLEETPLDLALVDISLPDGNGFAVCTAIKQAQAIPVLFLTASADEDSVVTGLCLGGDDYITKPFRPQELLARITAALRKSGRAPSVFSLHGLTVDTASGMVQKQGQEVFLSPLEYRLLLIFLNNPNMILTRDRLLDELWDAAGEFVNNNTLTVYIKRLREADMVRNKELRQLALACAVIAALSAVGGFALHPAAGFLSLVSSAALGGVFLGFTRARYRRIAQLAEEVDRVLHNADTLSIQDAEEGERSILHSELTKMTLRLREQNAALRREKRHLADIAHQLRTPLTAANLTLSLLKTTKEPQERRTLLRETQVLFRQMDWLLNTLLKQSRLDADMVVFQRAPVAVDDLVRAALRPFLLSFELHSITLETDLSPGATWMGDRHWLTEALQNLLKNALDSMQDHGCLQIRCEDTLLFTQLTLHDSGPGFAPADLPHLFHRFYRGTGTGNTTGYGIGLSLCKTIITQQGGQITADNHPQGGAVFTIRFPK